MGVVHMMKLESMVQYRDRGFTGHRFTISIDLTDPRDCNLKWYERTNHPYVDAPYWRGGEWHDLAAHANISEVFTPWSLHEGSAGRHVNYTRRSAGHKAQRPHARLLYRLFE